MNKRFEQVDKRFEEMLKHHDQHFLWLLSFMATCTGIAITAARFL